MNVAIIKAGGVGSRMGGDIPKQFMLVGEKPIIIHTLSVFEKHPNIDKIIVICVSGWEDILTAYAKNFNITKLVKIVEGGRTSLDSIKNGVEAAKTICNGDDIVLIHDANRPLVSNDIISNVLAESKKHKMAVAAIPCRDEVGIVETEESRESHSFADHKLLYRIQTPDAYQMRVLSELFDKVTEEELDTIGATNILAIKYGFKMYFAKGSEINIRLTTQEDIVLLEALMLTRNNQSN